MWNTNGYIEPSGYPSSSGFSNKYGYGHEEWNNKANRFWRGFKLFHTEATDRLLEYSTSGELGIMMVASTEGNQYAIGVATSVYHNDEEERELIAEELNIFDEWKQIWSLDIVKSKFKSNQKSFLKHWKENYKWVHWKCPKDQYFYFKQPLLLDPKSISGKSRIALMHGSFQAIYPEQVISIIENYIPKKSPIISWLSEPDFDDSLISKSLKDFKKGKKRWPKREIRTGTNSPSTRKFKYWVEGERSVEPHHADLQSKFVRFLRASGIEYKENENYIDVQYHKNGKKYYSEIKPTENVETKYAIRAAIGQLLEYQYSFDKKAIPEIVVGKKPKKKELDFVNAIGFCISYYDSRGKTFLTIEPTK